MESFAVVQSRFETIPDEALIEVLIQCAGLTHADARRAMRRNHGILGDSFSRDQANAVQKKLTRLGFQVRVVLTDELPVLPEPRTIRWFEIDEEEMRIPEGIRGDTVPMPWKSVFVISIGQLVEVKQELVASRKSLTHFDDDDFSGLTPKYASKGKLVEVLDIIGIDEEERFRYLRLPSREINYARIMGEGTQLNRYERFMVIVDFLVAHCQEAIVSPETRKALVHRNPDQRTFEGEGHDVTLEVSFRNYNRWLLTQAIHREQTLEESPDFSKIVAQEVFEDQQSRVHVAANRNRLRVPLR